MAFPALEQYLACLQTPERRQEKAGSTARVWLDSEGRAQGNYFSSTLTSAFQPVRLAATGDIVGYEGFVRSYSEHDSGLSIWKLLDNSASDDESVELDRLCRMLHSVNFYRQFKGPASGDAATAAGAAEVAGSGKPAGQVHGNEPDFDLYLSVHGRLLAAVGSNHGMSFRRILNLLELPHDRIVLQIPAVTAGQGWLLNYVLDNYRRNGFRLAVGAVDATAALLLVDTVPADIIKVDGRQLNDEDSVARLLEAAGRRCIKVDFKRVENPAVAATLHRLAVQTGQTVYAQGYFWDTPGDTLIVPADKAA